MKNLVCYFTLNFNLDKYGIKFGDLNKQSIYNFGLNVVKVIVILVFMYLIIKIGNGIINRYVSKQKNFKFSLDDKKS